MKRIFLILSALFILNVGLSAAAVDYSFQLGGGVTAGALPLFDDNGSAYKSSFTQLPCYVDPNLHMEFNFLFGDAGHFSIDPFIEFNAFSVVNGAKWFWDTSKKWTNYMNLPNYFFLKYTIYGLGEGFMFLGAAIYAAMGIDYGFHLYYHPLKNEHKENYFDLKLGAGIKNEPSLFMDYYGYSVLFYPMADVRLEGSLVQNSEKFRINFYTGYDFDIFGKAANLSMIYGGINCTWTLQRASF